MISKKTISKIVSAITSTLADASHAGKNYITEDVGKYEVNYNFFDNLKILNFVKVLTGILKFANFLLMRLIITAMMLNTAEMI